MKVTMSFTVDELNVVLAGLGELPAKQSLAIIQRIQQEATEQLKQQEAPKAE